MFVIFGRYLEAEGLEKTFKFKQKNIADVVDVTSARKVIVLYDITWDWGGGYPRKQAIGKYQGFV